MSRGFATSYIIFIALFIITVSGFFVVEQYGTSLHFPREISVLPEDSRGHKKSSDEKILPSGGPLETAVPIKVSPPQQESAKSAPASQLPVTITQNEPPLAELTTQSSPLVTPQLPSFGEINISAREAMVNVLCTTKSGGPFSSISGSGVIIDKRGVVLTNAHLGQFFLLKDYLVQDFVDCRIRTGSPAMPKYKATLLYISPRWIEENAHMIKEESPRGTGENDFSLLLITESVNQNLSLPEIYPSLAYIFDDNSIVRDENVLLVSYPAGFLGGISIQKDLYIASSITSIQNIYTFTKNTSDLISLGGTINAQSGSSGGAVINQKGNLLGIVTTTSEGATTGERDLRAITLSHINRSLRDNMGLSLWEYLSGDVQARAAAFNNNEVPRLTQILTDVLK